MDPVTGVERVGCLRNGTTKKAVLMRCSKLNDRDLYERILKDTVAFYSYINNNSGNNPAKLYNS